MINKKYILLFLVLWGSSTTFLFAQTKVESDIRVQIPVSTKKSLYNLPAPIYRENLKNDSLELRIAISELEMMKDRFPGLKVVPASVELDQSDMAADLVEALTFTKYPTYQQYDSMMHYFADTYPAICMIDTFGKSTEGRLLLAVKISDNVQSEEDEPAFLYTSTMHGDELIGYSLTLHLIDFILSSYGSNVEINRIVDELEIWINPLSNPDYTYHGSDSTVANSTRPYYSGDYLNLNRGFPDPSVDDANDTAGIYLENQFMMLFMMDKEFNMSANIHSGAEVVNYPWDYTNARHPDDDWYIFISREYADEAHAVSTFYMNGFTDGITNGYDWYDIYGGRQDYTNYYLHDREVTLELSNTKKVPSESLETYWDYNQWSLINMISQAMYGIHGNVKSGNTDENIRARIWVRDHDDEQSWVESDSISGNFYRYLKEGTYDLIVSAEGYISDTITEVEVIDYYKTERTIKLDSIGTGINEEFFSEQLKIYPNPARDIVTIEFKNVVSQPKLVEAYNTVGGLMYSEEWPKGEEVFRINLEGFSSGYYVVRVSSGGEVFRGGIVVR
jgi:hypothetical protein